MNLEDCDVPTNIDVPNSVNQLPIFEWCVVRCGSKNGYQKGIICLSEIGICAQNIITHSRLNSQHFFFFFFFLWGGTLYDQLKSMGISSLMRHKIFIQAPKTTRKVATASIWICHPPCTKREFHSLGEVGALDEEK